jgi:chromate transporter
MLTRIFLNFLKIGTFSIGGGYTMLPLAGELIVKKEKWVSEERFLELLTLAQGTPGVMAVNLSILIGLELAGIKGAVIALIGSTLSAFVSTVLIASVLIRFFKNTYVLAFLKGALPAAVGIIAAFVWQIGKKGFKTKEHLLLAVLAFVFLVFLKINPMFIIILGLILVFTQIKIVRKI